MTQQIHVTRMKLWQLKEQSYCKLGRLHQKCSIYLQKENRKYRRYWAMVQKIQNRAKTDRIKIATYAREKREADALYSSSLRRFAAILPQSAADDEATGSKVPLPNLSQTLRAIANIFGSHAASSEDSIALKRRPASPSALLNEDADSLDTRVPLDQFDQNIAVLFRQGLELQKQWEIRTTRLRSAWQQYLDLFKQAETAMRLGRACTVDLWTQELHYHRLCADCCRTHKRFQHKLQHILREINQAELRRQTRLSKLLDQHHAVLLKLLRGCKQYMDSLPVGEASKVERTEHTSSTTTPVKIATASTTTTAVEVDEAPAVERTEHTSSTTTPATPAASTTPETPTSPFALSETSSSWLRQQLLTSSLVQVTSHFDWLCCGLEDKDKVSLLVQSTEPIWVEVLCVLTVDGFLHIFETPFFGDADDKDYFASDSVSPAQSLHLRSSCVTSQRAGAGQYCLCLEHTSRGYLWNSTSVHLFRNRDKSQHAHWLQTLCKSVSSAT